MERSSIYRRALAPIMIVAGILGMIAALVPSFTTIDTNSAFSIFWTATSVIVFVIALLLVRRQALQDAEPFWSPPTRRVWQALLPHFFVGLVIGSLFIIQNLMPPQTAWILPSIWMLFYGCGLHAAGFFMQRSMKLFGWLLILFAVALLFCTLLNLQLQSVQVAHYVMGVFFGLCHLSFGIYLFFTERRKNEA